MLPLDKSIKAQQTYVIGERAVTLEALCTYKVEQIMGLLTQFSEVVNLTGIVDSLNNGQPTGPVVLASLPKLFTHAPDMVLRAVAVCLIGNGELEELFGGEAGAIEARVKQEMKFLRFHAEAPQVIELAGLYLERMGLDALKNALARLVTVASEAFGANSSTPTP